MNRLAIVLLSAVIITGMAGCAKEGDTGPAGKNGNANVYTRIFEVTPADWATSSYNQGTMGEIHCQLIDTNVTIGIIDSGSVQVYQQLGYSELLPITDVGTTSYGNHLTFTTAHITQNSVRISRFRDDDSLPPLPFYNTKYKVVITQGHH